MKNKELFCLFCSYLNGEIYTYCGKCLKRTLFWEYLLSEKFARPAGVTDRRLEKIRYDILMDDNFWFQVISRCGADEQRPEDFYRETNSVVDRSRSAFWSMIREKLQQNETSNKK